MHYHITKSELEILNVLWKADKPLSRADILEKSENKTWKDNSIHILLNGLLKKELIKEDGFTRSGKVWGRLYAPTFTVEEYYADLLSAGPRLDPVSFLKLILEQNTPDPTMIKAMQAILYDKMPLSDGKGAF